MSDPWVLQDAFLRQLCEEKVDVSIFLVNGVKLYGVIEAYDQYVVMLKGTVTQMIYKHAISTVLPHTKQLVPLPPNANA